MSGTEVSHENYTAQSTKQAAYTHLHRDRELLHIRCMTGGLPMASGVSMILVFQWHWPTVLYDFALCQFRPQRVGGHADESRCLKTGWLSVTSGISMTATASTVFLYDFAPGLSRSWTRYGPPNTQDVWEPLIFRDLIWSLVPRNECFSDGVWYLAFR